MQPETLTQPVALPRLTPEETLYRLMIEHVNPEEYDGTQCEDCLFGQVARALGWDFIEDLREPDVFLVDLLGLPRELAHEIYMGVYAFGRNLSASLALARRELGVER